MSRNTQSNESSVQTNASSSLCRPMEYLGIRSRIRIYIYIYPRNVYNAIHFHLYTWLEYRRDGARGRGGKRGMIRFRIRWHQAANPPPRIGWPGYRSFGRLVKHDQCASTLFNINVGYACIMSPDIYIADHATCATALSPRQDYYYLYYKITEGLEGWKYFRPFSI